MADSDAAVATPPAEIDTTKTEPQKPVLDSNRPLSQQVDKILANMPPKEDDADPDKTKPKEESPPDEKKPEAETVTAPPAPAEPPNPADDEETESYVAPKDLPNWQKYVLDNLPDISVIGHTPDKSDKAYTVKRVEDLPDDFEFANKRAELAFGAAIASQEVNARDLLNRYNQEQQQVKYQEFKAQEAVDIQADITALQKQGILPAFQYAHDDAKFNDDPAVKEANAIYDLYEKTNQAYIQSKRTYRISYRDAADKYYAQRGRTATKPVETPPAKTDNKERETVASKVSAPQNADPSSTKKVMPAGSTMNDVLRLYKLGRI